VHRERLRGVLGGWRMHYQVRQDDELYNAHRSDPVVNPFQPVQY
jgi:hypothetical protein